MSNSNKDVEALLKQYKTSILPELKESLTQTTDINSKYQLAPGTETDFNNCAKFLYYAQTKHSKSIESSETDISTLFGKYLVKYYESYLTNNEIDSLLKYIIEYNTNIDVLYNKNYNLDTLDRILYNVLGLNPESLDIADGSFLHKIYEEIKYNYIAAIPYTNKDNDFIQVTGDIEFSEYTYFTKSGNDYSLIKSSEELALASTVYKLTENAIGKYNSYYYENLFKVFVLEYIKRNYLVNGLENTTITVNSASIKKIDSKPIDTSINLYENRYNIYQKVVFNGSHNYDIKLGNVKDIVCEYITTSSSNDINDYQVTYTLSSETKDCELYINETTNKLYYKIPAEDVKTFGEAGTTNIGFTFTVSGTTTNVPSVNIADYYLLNSYCEAISYSNIESYANTVFALINANLKLDDEINTAINIFKIRYNVSKIETKNIYDNLNEYYKNEKRNSSDIETYYVSNSYNLNFFNLNVIVNKDEPLYTTYKNITLSDIDDDYIYININILYKELNSYIRQIDISEIQNKLLNGLLKTNPIDYSLYEKISDKKSIQNILTEDECTLFLGVKTNSFIIRSSAEDDIVAYLAGDIINFGSNSAELNDIESIKKLYKEVRTYFYKVLLNNAFVTEDKYDLFKLLYIKAYTIERFISSRLDNIQDINNFNKTDCRNFLISYGLKVLSDQIESADFVNSLEFQKRIISYYSKIMNEKGSRKIITDFLDIFDYKTTEIEIFKYLLYRDYNANGDIYFARLPYLATNIYGSIELNKNKKKKYSEFIKNDPYWTEEDVPEEDLKQIIESPTSTKYMGLSLKKDVYMSYIKTEYVLAIARYIFNKMIINDTGNISIFSRLKTTATSLYDNKDISILTMYNAIIYVLALYTYLNKKNINSLSPVSLDHVTNNDNGVEYDKIYGINDRDTIDSLDSIDPNIKNLFDTKYYYIENSQQADRQIGFFPYESGILSTTDNPAGSVDILTIKIQKGYESVIDKYYTETEAYNLYKNRYSERVSDSGFIAYDEINKILDSLNIINIFNGEDVDANLLRAFILYYVTNDNYNPTNIKQFNDLISLSTDNFYNILFNKLLNFPINYLDGAYGNHTDIFYDKQTTDLIDTIFKTFFVSSTHDITDSIFRSGLFSRSFCEFDNVANSIYGTDKEAIKASIISILQNLLGNDIVGNNGSILEISNTQNTAELRETVYNTLTLLINELNEVISVYANMTVDVTNLNNLNNMFAFIKTCIEFFISYTSTLYDSNLIFKIDTQNERIPITYSIKEKIENPTNEYFYSDETISIMEFGD